MGNGHELKSASSRALRAAGYVPLPRWWVTREQLELIAYMAEKNSDEVNRIRLENRRPMNDVERAWAEHEKRK